MDSTDARKMNERRAELAFKKKREGLTQPEAEEFEKLQSQAREHLTKIYTNTEGESR